MIPPDAVAEGIMTALVTALGDAAPTRRYRTAGMPAWDAQGSYLGDGDQLTVGLLRLIPGQPGRPDMAVQQSVNLSLVTAEFEVELVRAVPYLLADGTQPSASVMDASGVARMTEIQLVRDALRAITVPGFQPPITPTPPLSILLGASSMKGPEGGALGMSTMLQVGL